MRALHSILCMQCCITHSAFRFAMRRIFHSHFTFAFALLFPHAQSLCANLIRIESIFQPVDGVGAGRPRIRSSPAAQRNVHCINCNKTNSYKWYCVDAIVRISPMHISGYQISAHASNSHKYALLTTSPKKKKTNNVFVIEFTIRRFAYTFRNRLTYHSA